MLKMFLSMVFYLILVSFEEKKKKTANVKLVIKKYFTLPFYCDS